MLCFLRHPNEQQLFISTGPKHGKTVGSCRFKPQNKKSLIFLEFLTYRIRQPRSSFRWMSFRFVRCSFPSENTHQLQWKTGDSFYLRCIPASVIKTLDQRCWSSCVFRSVGSWTIISDQELAPLCPFLWEYGTIRKKWYICLYSRYAQIIPHFISFDKHTANQVRTVSSNVYCVLSKSAFSMESLKPCALS